MDGWLAVSDVPAYTQETKLMSQPGFQNILQFPMDIAICTMMHSAAFSKQFYGVPKDAEHLRSMQFELLKW